MDEQPKPEEPSQQHGSSFKPRGPLATTDLVIELEAPAPSPGGGAASAATAEPPRIVLVQRKNPPHGWALPGGFIDAGERAAEAARREAKEETGLDVELTELLGVYSDPARDPRGIFTLSVVFIARAPAGSEPVGGDDAAVARAFALDALPADVVFDHPTIIDDYRRLRQSGRRPPPDR